MIWLLFEQRTNDSLIMGAATSAQSATPLPHYPTTLNPKQDGCPLDGQCSEFQAKPASEAPAAGGCPVKHEARPAPTPLAGGGCPVKHERGGVSDCPAAVGMGAGGDVDPTNMVRT